MKNRPFFLLSALSMVAILWIGLSMDHKIVEAKVATPDGYSKPIIALEFALDTSIINAVFNLPEPEESIRKAKAGNLNWSTNLDFLYIFAYGSFMLLFAFQCKRLQGTGFGLPAILTLLAAFSDVMENMQLKKIFVQVAAGSNDFSEIFGPLRFWMALKFFAITAFFLALAPFLWRSNWIGKIVVATAALALFFLGMACFYKPEWWASAFFNMILLLFSGDFVFGLTYKNRKD